MSKQTKLRKLLDEYAGRVIDNNDAWTRPGEYLSEARRMHQLVRVAENRIFSFVAELEKELEVTKRNEKRLFDQAAELIDALGRRNVYVVPEQAAIPFDLERARDGDPIQYEPLAALGKWIDCRFIGVRENGEIVIEVERMHMFGHPTDKLRMKPKQAKTVQMFANVYLRDGEYCGYLSPNEPIAKSRASTDVIAIAQPVTVTVAE